MFGRVSSERVELRLRLRSSSLLQAFEPSRQRLALGQQRRDVLALRLGLPNRLRVRVTRGAHLVRRDLRRLAALLERAEVGRGRARTTPREVARNALRVGPEQAGVEHVEIIFGSS